MNQTHRTAEETKELHLRKISKRFKSGAAATVTAATNGFIVHSGGEDYVVGSLQDVATLLEQHLTYVPELREYKSQQDAEALYKKQGEELQDLNAQNIELNRQLIDLQAPKSAPAFEEVDENTFRQRARR